MIKFKEFLNEYKRPNPPSVNWPNDDMEDQARTAIRHYEYADDAIDFLASNQPKEMKWIQKNRDLLSKWFAEFGLEK